MAKKLCGVIMEEQHEPEEQHLTLVERENNSTQQKKKVVYGLKIQMPMAENRWGNAKMPAKRLEPLWKCQY